jgi:sugar lactone lactonase YvrE
MFFTRPIEVRTPHPTRRGGPSSAAESTDGAEIFAAGEFHGTLVCEDRDNRPEVDGGDLRHSFPAGNCLAPTPNRLSESRESTEVRVVLSNGLRKWLALPLGAVAILVAAAGASGAFNAGTITTIAGTDVWGFSGDGGPATSAKLYAPAEVAVDARGNVYIATYQDSRVRRVSPDGTISTFAGTGQPGFSGDGGPATSAKLYAPKGVAVDGQGNVYIADSNNFRVRKVSPGGTITTFAGGGRPGSLGDGGPATLATLRNPFGVAVDGQGNVYIADTDNMRVRKVSTGGTITTIAGTGAQGSSGDGGPATSALLRFPYGLAVDGEGNVYFADSGNNRVRRISRGGTITAFAGTGANSFSGDGGPATSAQLQIPRDVALDGSGSVYIADGNNRVRKVSPGGTISTFAGGGRAAPGDGGLATAAQLKGVWGVAVDGKGSVYFAEGGRVRKVTVGTEAAAPKLTLGGAASQPLLVKHGVTVSAKADRPCTLAAGGKLTIIGTRHVFILTPSTAKLAAAGSRTLTLRLPASALKRFRLLWKPGLKARVTITVRATDKAGRTSTSKRIVTVRR